MIYMTYISYILIEKVRLCVVYLFESVSVSVSVSMSMSMSVSVCVIHV